MSRPKRLPRQPQENPGLRYQVRLPEPYVDFLELLAYRDGSTIAEAIRYSIRLAMNLELEIQKAQDAIIAQKAQDAIASQKKSQA